MSRKIFISYCHRQGDWVWHRLVPCLKAGGAEVLIDVERFKAGVSVYTQMNAEQDQSDASLLVLTPEYLTRADCLHEMRRAVARDPNFDNGSTIPIILEKCELPDEIKASKPLWVNLIDDRNVEWWDKLMRACEADLGADVPHWLEVRDETLLLLERGQSVNLIVKENPRWRELITHMGDNHPQGLRIVDLDSGATNSRRALVEELLKAAGANQSVPPKPEDLVILHRALVNRPSASQIALLHGHRLSRSDYESDLLSALRNLIMDERKLVLLIHSRRSFAELVASDPDLSAIDLKTVELNGRKR